MGIMKARSARLGTVWMTPAAPMTGGISASRLVRTIPAGTASNGKDLGEDPQLNHDGYFARLPHPEMGEVDYACHSITFSRSPQRMKRSPCLGEHTAQICMDILGMDPDTFSRLKNEGVFE